MNFPASKIMEHMQKEKTKKVITKPFEIQIIICEERKKKKKRQYSTAL